MNKILLIFFTLTIFIKIGFSQKIITDFPTPAKYEEIPNNYDDYDAVILFQKRTVTIIADPSMGGLNTVIFTHTKTKINTKQGIQEHARIVVPKFPGQKMDAMLARTIKKNGEVVNLNQNDIKEINLSSSRDIHRKLNFLLFSIPGVEVGDEVEVVTRYVGAGLITSEDFYLNTYLPCINSNFRLLISPLLSCDVKTYNKMPEPLVSKVDKFIAYEWELKDLPTFEDQEYSIRNYDSPFIRFAIRTIKVSPYDFFSVEENSWASFVESVLKETDSKMTSWKSLNGFLKDNIGKEETASLQSNKFASLVKIHRFICDSIKVVDLPREQSDRTLIYYVNQRKIDQRNLILLYDKLFNYLGIKYYVGFARNKYEGDFDDSFVASHLITNIFLSFEIDGLYYFIFLKTEDESYEIAEIPTELQGTKAILIAVQDTKEHVKQTQLLIPEKTNNFRRIKHMVNINLSENSFQSSTKETYSGSVSTNYRQNFISLNNEKIKDQLAKKHKELNDNIILDSIYSDKSIMHKFPYTFNLSYKYHIDENEIASLDKNLYSISLNNMFQHISLKPGLTERISDFYTDYLYTDNIKYYMVFDKKVEISNKENTEIKFSNEFGSYTLSVKQINENAILIDSNYDINATTLKKSQYSFLKEIYDASQKANKSQLVIKTIE